MKLEIVRLKQSFQTINGEPLREINRSYYHSNAYEFPAQFLKKNGKT